MVGRSVCLEIRPLDRVTIFFFFFFLMKDFGRMVVLVTFLKRLKTKVNK